MTRTATPMIEPQNNAGTSPITRASGKSRLVLLATPATGARPTPSNSGPSAH